MDGVWFDTNGLPLLFLKSLSYPFMRIALVLLGVLMIRTGGLGFGRFLNQTPNSGFGRATSPPSLVLVHTSVVYVFIAELKLPWGLYSPHSFTLL